MTISWKNFNNDDSTSVKTLKIKNEGFNELPDEIINDPRYHDVASIIFLNCRGIEVLNSYPESIQFIDIGDCHNLERISDLPNNLVKLSIQNCDSLFTITDLPDSLVELEILQAHNLSSVSDFGSNLKFIQIGNTAIKSLPTLPDSLIYLYCANNDLNELPILPSNLIFLNCSYNNIRSIPNIPPNIQIFNVTGNDLDENIFRSFTHNDEERQRLINILNNGLNESLLQNSGPMTPPTSPPRSYQVMPLIEHDRVSHRRTRRIGRTRVNSIQNEQPNRYQIRRNREHDNTETAVNSFPRSLRIDIQDESPQVIYNTIQDYNFPQHSNEPLESNNPLQFDPTTNTYDVIENDYVSINNYLDSPDAINEGRFVLHLNGEYICQSLEGLRLSNRPNPNSTNYNEFYECKDETPSDWQANMYVRKWIKPNGRGPLVKIMGPGGVNYLVEKPSFFWNGPVPGSRVFNMVELPDKVKLFASIYVLPITSDFDVLGADHCNQTQPERIYKLELMEPENVGGKLRKTKKINRNRKTKKINRNKIRNTKKTKSKK
jgi:hypothetical protein